MEKTFIGTLSQNNTFSIAVPGTDLAASTAKNVQVRVTTYDDAGNQGSAFVNHNYANNVIPIVNNGTVTGMENPATPITITLSGADADGVIATFTVTNLPLHGTLYTDSTMTTTVGVGTPLAAVNNSVSLYLFQINTGVAILPLLILLRILKEIIRI